MIQDIFKHLPKGTTGTINISLIENEDITIDANLKHVNTSLDDVNKLFASKPKMFDILFNEINRISKVTFKLENPHQPKRRVDIDIYVFAKRIGYRSYVSNLDVIKLDYAKIYNRFSRNVDSFAKLRKLNTQMLHDIKTYNLTKNTDSHDQRRS